MVKFVMELTGEPSKTAKPASQTPTQTPVKEPAPTKVPESKTEEAMEVGGSENNTDDSQVGKFQFCEITNFSFPSELK